MRLQIRLLQVCGWNRKGSTTATEISFASPLDSLGTSWVAEELWEPWYPAGSRCACRSQRQGSEAVTPESQAVLDPHCQVCSRGCFFNGWALCCPVPKNAGLGCVVICDTKSSQSYWWEWWSVMAFHYLSCQTDFLARAVNSLLPLCPQGVQRCTSVSSTRIPGAGKKDGCYIPVQSFSDKAEPGFWEQGWNEINELEGEDRTSVPGNIPHLQQFITHISKCPLTMAQRHFLDTHQGLAHQTFSVIVSRTEKMNNFLSWGQLYHLDLQCEMKCLRTFPFSPQPHTS